MLQLLTVSALCIATVTAFGCGDADTKCSMFALCDIRQLECQTSALRNVQCRYGEEVALPQVSVITASELSERLNAQLPQDSIGEASFAQQARALSLFGFAPPDYRRDRAIADRVSSTAAIYYGEGKELLIIDRGQPLDDASTMALFAHELVHAFQDAKQELNSTENVSFDATLARQALIEGEAVHYQQLVAAELAGTSITQIDWFSTYQAWQQEELREADLDAAPIVTAEFHFPYAFGGAFVTQHWLAHGRSGIDALFASPPRTTREILFGGPAAEQETIWQRGVPEVADGLELLWSDSLGAWMAGMFAARAGAPDFNQRDAAHALESDAFSVQYDPEHDKVVAAWRFRLSPEMAVENWPGFGGKAFQSWADPANPREGFLIASDGDLPGEPWALQWSPPANSQRVSQVESSAPVTP